MGGGGRVYKKEGVRKVLENVFKIDTAFGGFLNDRSEF